MPDAARQCRQPCMVPHHLPRPPPLHPTRARNAVPTLLANQPAPQLAPAPSHISCVPVLPTSPTQPTCSSHPPTRAAPPTPHHQYRAGVLARIQHLQQLDALPFSEEEQMSARSLLLAAATALPHMGVLFSAAGCVGGGGPGGLPAVYDPSEVATGLLGGPGGERVPGQAWIGAGLPFMAAGFPGPGGVTGAVTSKASPGAAPGAGGGTNKLAALVPSVLNYDALSQQLGGGLSGLGGGHNSNSSMLPGGAGGSVPSIQSGTLVLSGAAAFGLEGTSLGGNSLGALGAGLRPPSGRTMPAAPGGGGGVGGSSSGKEAALVAGMQNLTMGSNGSRRLRATGSLGSYGR
jgi:hypothetical protein